MTRLQGQQLNLNMHILCVRLSTGNQQMLPNACPCVKHGTALELTRLH